MPAPGIIIFIASVGGNSGSAGGIAKFLCCEKGNDGFQVKLFFSRLSARYYTKCDGDKHGYLAFYLELVSMCEN